MKPIEELTFTDDYMFGYVMRNEEICKGLLERLLDIKIQRLEFPTLQKSIAPHYESKGVRLDVYVQDSTRVFDIEIQNSLDEDLPTRTRYYQSMMDIDLLLKGKQYSQLKESFVIFVCKDDFFKENLPCYTFSNLCHEKLTLELGDKTHKIIFNAAAFQQEKDLEKKSILEYIKNSKSTSDFTQKIHQIVEQTKENQAFRGEYMAWGLAEQDAEKRGYKAGITDGIAQGIVQGIEQGIAQGIERGIAQGIEQGMEQGIEQGMAQGIAQGMEQKAFETAQNLLVMDLSLDNIAKATGLSLETLQKLVAQENASNK